ncbi:MAG: Sigma-70 region 2 [Thermoanaerobaculia bacterium]|jgi:RNA polymerase sigma factor (sigma-70 family)|nr:Sigma-70 region 2 [Thermoanaerobaculia bacterium]
MAAFRLTPIHVVQAAGRIAAEMGFRRSISRQYFGRLRNGSARATEEKILLLVMAVRELTGFAIRASDLFALEPAIAGGSGPLLTPDILMHGNTLVPISSPGAGSRAWRAAVPDTTGPAGDDAFEALYREYGLLLRSIAMRRYGIPPDDAEALAHDTFIAYLERHTKIQDLKPWLMGAVCNASKHYWRDRKREAPLPENFQETADPSADCGADSWAWRITVAGLVARLGTQCRETLQRYYWADESKEKIAATLSLSPGYVLHLLSSCRQRIREMLGRRGHDAS